MLSQSGAGFLCIPVLTLSRQCSLKGKRLLLDVWGPSLGLFCYPLFQRNRTPLGPVGDAAGKVLLY